LPYISGGQIWDSSNTRFNQDGFLTTIKVWDTGQVRFNIVAGQNYDKAIEVIRPIIVAVWGNDVLDWITKHSGAAINVVQNGTIGNFNITMWTGNSFAYLDITPSNLSPDKIMP
jgi:hypothetical protein